MIGDEPENTIKDRRGPRLLDRAAKESDLPCLNRARLVTRCVPHGETSRREAMGRAAEVVAPSSSIRTDGDCPVAQVDDFSRSLTAFDPISSRRTSPSCWSWWVAEEAIRPPTDGVDGPLTASKCQAVALQLARPALWISHMIGKTFPAN